MTTLFLIGASDGIVDSARVYNLLRESSTETILVPGLGDCVLGLVLSRSQPHSILLILAAFVLEHVVQFGLRSVTQRHLAAFLRLLEILFTVLLFQIYFLHAIILEVIQCLSATTFFLVLELLHLK